MPFINVTEIQKLVNGQSFEQVQQIMKENNIKIRQLNTDDSKNLYLLISKNDNINKPLSLQCNGIILEKETNNIVCMSQNKFIDINHENNLGQQQIEELLSQSSYFTFEYCEDATRVSLYHYNGKWVTATTKCIDGKFSYWADKTFYELFWDNFDNSIELDTAFTYVFILKHINNRIVVKHSKNELVFVCRINNSSFEEDFTNIAYKMLSTTTLIKQVDKVIGDTIQFPLEQYFIESKRGLLFKFVINDFFVTFKYDFDFYTRVKLIRGNVPLIRERYIELLGKPNELNDLRYFYNEHHLLFAYIDHNMNNIYKQIHQMYIDSHIKHKLLVTDNHQFFQTLRQLHGHYKKHNTPITLNIVKEKVDSLNRHVLKKFLNWV